MSCTALSGRKFFPGHDNNEILHKESFMKAAPIVKNGAALIFLQLSVKKIANNSCNLRGILLQCVSLILSREDICT